MIYIVQGQIECYQLSCPITRLYTAIQNHIDSSLNLGVILIQCCKTVHVYFNRTTSLKKGGPRFDKFFRQQFLVSTYHKWTLIIPIHSKQVNLKTFRKHFTSYSPASILAFDSLMQLFITHTITNYAKSFFFCYFKSIVLRYHNAWDL